METLRGAKSLTTMVYSRDCFEVLSSKVIVHCTVYIPSVSNVTVYTPVWTSVAFPPLKLHVFDAILLGSILINEAILDFTVAGLPTITSRGSILSSTPQLSVLLTALLAPCVVGCDLI